MSSQEVVNFVQTRLAKGSRSPEELATICEAVSIQNDTCRCRVQGSTQDGNQHYLTVVSQAQ